MQIVTTSSQDICVSVFVQFILSIKVRMTTNTIKTDGNYYISHFFIFLVSDKL